MTTYNFYLKDAATPGSDWGEGTCYVIGLEMKTLFDEVCQLPSCPFSVSDFWWDPQSVNSTSVLVYFVNDSTRSLVRKVTPNAQLGQGGTTHISPAGNLSEVYVSIGVQDPNNPARALAVLAFHEVMHNLLQTGNGLHGSGGVGLAAATVYSNSKLTPKNKELVAKAMGKSIPQNTLFL